METNSTIFPPVPIRGVEAAYKVYTACPHHFAGVTMDFEPWEDGFAFEVADDAVVELAPSFETLPTLQAALREGIRETLLGHRPEIGIAVAVVVQRMRISHDSYAESFRRVGQLAVGEALTRAYSKPLKRKHRR